jgi:TPR repeat protein
MSYEFVRASALTWYRKGTFAGDADFARGLGFLYFWGGGAERSLTEARILLKPFAYGRNVDAMSAF